MDEFDFEQMSFMNNLLLETIFPYKVYLDYEVGTPDGGGPLMVIEAGFREKADAEFYIEMKSKMDGKKYVLKSNVLNDSPEQEE